MRTIITLYIFTTQGRKKGGLIFILLFWSQIDAEPIFSLPFVSSYWLTVSRPINKEVLSFTEFNLKQYYNVLITTLLYWYIVFIFIDQTDDGCIVCRPDKFICGSFICVFICYRNIVLAKGKNKSAPIYTWTKS